MRVWVLFGCAVLATGCANFDFQRLAPPGLIRYERIADEKEPNAAVVEQVRAASASEPSEFPKLGETAAGAASKTPIPNAGVADQIRALEADREQLEQYVARDQATSDAGREMREDLTRARNELREAIAQEKRAASGERAVSAPSVSDDNEK